MKPRDAAKALRSSGGFKFEPALQPVNVIVEEWARQTANGHQLQANAIARAMAEAEGAALPGGVVQLHPIVEKVDSIIAHGTPDMRRVIEIWYRSGDTSDVKARRYGVSRAGIYLHIRAALWYIRGALREAGVDLSLYDYSRDARQPTVIAR